MDVDTQPTSIANIDLSYHRLFTIVYFPRIAFSMVLARTAGQLWQVALILFVLQRFHSPVLAGLATFIAIVPGLLISPIVGALLDRYARLRLIQVDYGIAALSLVGIATLSLLHMLTPTLLLIIIGISSLTGPMSASGTRTLFPIIVPRELWDRANAVDSASMALATVIGPALAGILLALLGGEGVFIITAVVFAIAGAVLRKVQEPVSEYDTHAPLFRAAGQAVRYVVTHATLRGIILTLWVANVPFGILTVAIPYLAIHDLHWNAGNIGTLWSVAGIASIVAGVSVGRFNSEGRERRILFLGLAISASGAICFVFQTPIALFVGMILFGLAAGPIDIGLFALRQRKTDPRWLGRVMTVSMSLNFIGNPIGSAIAGPILEWSITATLLLAAGIAVSGCFMPYLAIPRE